MWARWTVANQSTFAFQRLKLFYTLLSLPSLPVMALIAVIRFHPVLRLVLKHFPDPEQVQIRKGNNQYFLKERWVPLSLKLARYWQDLFTAAKQMHLPLSFTGMTGNEHFDNQWKRPHKQPLESAMFITATIQKKCDARILRQSNLNGTKQLYLNSLGTRACYHWKLILHQSQTSNSVNGAPQYKCFR